MLAIISQQEKGHNVTIDSLTEEYEEAQQLALSMEQPAAANGATYQGKGVQRKTLNPFGARQLTEDCSLFPRKKLTS